MLLCGVVSRKDIKCHIDGNGKIRLNVYRRRKMQYIYESGKDRRVMHIQRHNVSGVGLWEALCGSPIKFNRTINAPFALGRTICKDCLREFEADE